MDAPSTTSSRRPALLCAAWFVLGLAGLLVFSISTMPAIDPEGAAWRSWARVGVLGCMAASAVLAWGMVRRATTEEKALDAVEGLITCSVAALLASRLLMVPVLGEATFLGGLSYPAQGVLDLLVLHTVACAILPGGLERSASPFVPGLVLWSIGLLLPIWGGWEIFDRLALAILAPATLLPGMGLALVLEGRRAQQRRRTELGAQLQSMGGELSRARIIHDAMFPTPVKGAVEFDYDYQPLHEIGGDYVNLHVCPTTGRTVLTILDVAGHGLAAALTVNRLHGELERIRAEHGDAGPDEVMTLLNRYVALTMARHNLYATGLCILMDPVEGRLDWVNAGHPPALLRREGGTVEDLPCTTVLLGALRPDEFDPDMRTRGIGPGDLVVACTDGATEATDSSGRQFGYEGLRRTLCFDPPPRDWNDFITNAVRKHHGGRIADDVLIVTLLFHAKYLVAPDSPVEDSESRATSAGSSYA